MDMHNLSNSSITNGYKICFQIFATINNTIKDFLTQKFICSHVGVCLNAWQKQEEHTLSPKQMIRSGISGLKWVLLFFYFNKYFPRRFQKFKLLCMKYRNVYFPGALSYGVLLLFLSCVFLKDDQRLLFSFEFS